MIRRATLEALEFIMRRLREEDRREVFATRWHDDPEQAAAEVFNACADTAYVSWQGGVPVAAIGYFRMWPGVVSVWAFGTDNWRQAIREMTRFVREFMIPTLIREGAHRAECRALVGRTDTYQWLTRSVGMHVEAVLAGFGRQREDFLLYVRQHNDQPDPADPS